MSNSRKLFALVSSFVFVALSVGPVGAQWSITVTVTGTIDTASASGSASVPADLDVGSEYTAQITYLTDQSVVIAGDATSTEFQVAPAGYEALVTASGVAHAIPLGTFGLGNVFHAIVGPGSSTDQYVLEVRARPDAADFPGALTETTVRFSAVDVLAPNDDLWVDRVGALDPIDADTDIDFTAAALRVLTIESDDLATSDGWSVQDNDPVTVELFVEFAPVRSGTSSWGAVKSEFRQ